MKKVLLLIGLLLLTGCQKYTTYETIDYTSFNNMLEEKKSFVLVIGSESCGACVSYKTTMEEVISKYQVAIYFIDISKLSETDLAKLNSKFTYTYTPTTIFITDGEEISTYDRLEGAASKNDVVSSLQKKGYIKGDK